MTKTKTEALLGSTASGDSTVPTVHVGGHTPLPWSVEGKTVYVLRGRGTFTGKGKDYREEQENRFTAHVQGVRTPDAELLANAKLIVTAVNHHAELVEALRLTMVALRQCRDNAGHEWDALTARPASGELLYAWNRNSSLLRKIRDGQ